MLSTTMRRKPQPLPPTTICPPSRRRPSGSTPPAGNGTLPSNSTQRSNVVWISAPPSTIRSGIIICGVCTLLHASPHGMTVSSRTREVDQLATSCRSIATSGRYQTPTFAIDLQSIWSDPRKPFRAHRARSPRPDPLPLCSTVDRFRLGCNGILRRKDSTRVEFSVSGKLFGVTVGVLISKLLSDFQCEGTGRLTSRSLRQC